MKKIWLSILFCFSLLWLMPGQAALDLELTQAMAGAMPIGIVPFVAAEPNVAGNTTMTAVISNDLNNSGQFRVVESNVFSQSSLDPKQLDVSYWNKQGVRSVIVGKVQPLITGKFKVTIELLGLPATGNSQAVSVLLSQAFTVGAAGLRPLAHHLSDIVYQKLLGVKGVFSTHIAYILVQHPQHKPIIYSLNIADQDGFNAHSILKSYQPIMSPTWTPNGQDIAYVSFEGGSSAIYLQNVASGQRQLISDYPGINGAPAFSADGKALALVLTQTGNPKIYTLDLASHQLTQITHGPSIDTEPSWAPDGQSLIFTSNRGGNPQIYRYYFSNKEISRVTFDGNYNARADFFPNEQGVIMMHRGSGLFGIAKQNLSSGQLQILTQSGNDESPSIAPNGEMIIYATHYDEKGVLGLVSIDGRVKLRIPAGNGDIREPAWSPFQ